MNRKPLRRRRALRHWGRNAHDDKFDIARAARGAVRLSRPGVLGVFGVLGGAGDDKWRSGAGQGRARSQAAAAARQSLQSGDAGARTVWPRAGGGAAPSRSDRLLFARLSRGRRAAADQRPPLAGHALVAQPQLGASQSHRLFETFFVEGGARIGLARPARRRSVATARRADALWPCVASDRARRRHLADADAQPRTHPRKSAKS